MRAAKNPFHPGKILLEEFLAPAGTTQTAFAEKRGVTADAAINLAETLGTTSKL